jgi:cbb3-type cytochrome oxidase subunit 3
MNDLMLDTSFTIAIGAVLLILILAVDYAFRKGRKKQRG